jgi:hypothetical protein
MYPQSFLKSLWRLKLKPQVFVAMSFEERYKNRFTEIIAPAIESIEVDGEKLKPYRVDLSKTGDSILTEIIDGIAHSQFFLADVSSIGKDSVSGIAYRNGNVMYEVGLALASRQPTEVLLIRDDQDKFLFDVSSIPHMTLDFIKKEDAKNRLQIVIEAKLKERNLMKDARLLMVLGSLTDEEVSALYYLKNNWEFDDEFNPNDFFGHIDIKSLLEKQIIECTSASFHSSSINNRNRNKLATKRELSRKYQITKFGENICKNLEGGYYAFRDKYCKVT